MREIGTALAFIAAPMHGFFAGFGFYHWVPQIGPAWLMISMAVLCDVSVAERLIRMAAREAVDA